MSRYETAPRTTAAPVRFYDCLCVTNCGEGDGCRGEHTQEGDCRACSHVGEWHSHDDDPCPAHPEAVIG